MEIAFHDTDVLKVCECGYVLLDKACYASAKDDQNVSSVPESFSTLKS